MLEAHASLHGRDEGEGARTQEHNFASACQEEFPCATSMPTVAPQTIKTGSQRELAMIHNKVQASAVPSALVELQLTAPTL